jgi:hypothetical protein
LTREFGIAAALTIGVPSIAGAQAPPGAGPGPRAQAASPDAPPMTPRPQRLAGDVTTIGKTSVTWVGESRC